MSQGDRIKSIHGRYSLEGVKSKALQEVPLSQTMRVGSISFDIGTDLVGIASDEGLEKGSVGMN